MGGFLKYFRRLPCKNYVGRNINTPRIMKLTDEVFRSFRVAKVFRENTDRINCIDFSANGENMISSSNDDSIVLYCCQEGRCAFIKNTIQKAGSGVLVF